MSYPTDLETVRQEMGPALFEQLIRDWAQELRDAKRERECRQGPGNRSLAWEQQIKGGNVTETWWQPPKRRYGRSA